MLFPVHCSFPAFIQAYAEQFFFTVLGHVLQFHLFRSISFSSDNNRGYLLQDKSSCSCGTLSDPLGLPSHYITSVSTSGSACAKGKSEVSFHLIGIGINIKTVVGGRCINLCFCSASHDSFLLIDISGLCSEVIVKDILRRYSE